MKTIGIIGGMSWESSAEYYRLINQQVKARFGPTHSAELVMYSLACFDSFTRGEKRAVFQKSETPPSLR